MLFWKNAAKLLQPQKFYFYFYFIFLNHQYNSISKQLNFHSPSNYFTIVWTLFLHFSSFLVVFGPTPSAHQFWMC